MAKIPGLKLSIDEVSQEIDLEEIFGVPLDDRPDLLEAFGQRAIERIIERTESGISVGGDKLKSPYSDEYAESLLFKAAGKSKTKVNMTMSGQMLGTLDVLEASGSKIKLGWDDDTENAKAYNHNTGDTVPKRDFFGLTQDEIETIAADIAPELRRDISDRNEAATSTLTTLRDMFGDDLLEVIDG